MNCIPLFTAACLAVTLCFGATAQAVEPAAPAAPAASPEKLALAREVMEASRMSKMFESMIPQLQQMTLQMVQGRLEGFNAEQRAIFDQFQQKATAVAVESAQAMLAKVDTVYASVYTTEELKAMKAFFLSPEGKSMLDKQPQIQQQIIPLVQRMQAEMMPRLQVLSQQFQEQLAATSAPAPAPVGESTPTVGLPAVK